MDPFEPIQSDDSLQRQREEIRRGLARVNLAAAIILTVLVGLVVLSVVSARRADRSAREALAAIRQGREELWKSYLAQARAERLTGLHGRGEQSLEAVAAAAKIHPSLPVRNEAIAAMALTDVLPEAAFTPYPNVSATHAFNSAADQLAWEDSKGVTHVLTLSDHHEVARLSGPEKPARLIRFSADGILLAVVHAKGEVVVWNLPKQERLFSVNYDDRYDRGPGIAFTPDNGLLAVGDMAAGAIRFFSTQNGREIRSIPETFPEQIVLHSRLPRVASLTSGDRIVKIRDWETGSLLAVYSNSTPVINLAWAPDAGILAAGTIAGEITLWNEKTNEKRLLPAHNGLISRLALSPDGNLLASGSWDGFSKLWDPRSGRQILTLQGGFAEAFSGDGTRLAFEREGVGWGWWPVRRGRILRVLDCDAGSRKTVFSTSFSPNGNLLAMTGNDGVRILETLGGTEVAMLPVPGGNLWGQTAMFLPNGHALVASSLEGIHVWNFRMEGARFLVESHRFIPVRRGEPGALKLTGDGKSVITAVNTETVLVVDLEQSKITLEINHPGVNSMAISPDGKWIATGTAHGDGHRVWDATTGKLVKHLDVAPGTVDFSPNSSLLLTGSTGEFVAWETGSWNRLFSVRRDAANERSAYGAFSPDGLLLAVVYSQDIIRLIDPRDGTHLADLASPEPRAANHLCFSADGAKLAVATSPNNVLLWDIRAAREKLSELGLDWGKPPAVDFERGPSPEFAESGFGPFAFFIFTVGGLAFAFACVVFQRHRGLIRAYAEVESRFEQRGKELDVARSEIMHSQKMKALGTLAAGIAHDFNNLLSVIRISNDLNEEASTRDEIRANTAEIDSAVQQGKTVVRSMLGYTRTAKDDGPYSLSDAVRDSLGLLSRQFLSGVALKLELDSDAPKVLVDRGRMEQILLNLVVNAAEAMKGAGALRVITRRADASGSWNVLRPSAKASCWTELVVVDSGPGIDPGLLARVFEPFFTTKNTGATRGTGLGLSIVYTIAHKDGLGIAVDSTPGSGAAFRILIPAMSAECTVENRGDAPTI
jgi:WD40 repeat protein/nitrogen-specific signal transduction histidine kinase